MRPTHSSKTAGHRIWEAHTRRVAHVRPEAADIQVVVHARPVAADTPKDIPAAVNGIDKK